MNLGHGVVWRGASEQSTKFSPQKLSFHQFAKVFSLKGFLLYGMKLGSSKTNLWQSTKFSPQILPFLPQRFPSIHYETFN